MFRTYYDLVGKDAVADAKELYSGKHVMPTGVLASKVTVNWGLPGDSTRALEDAAVRVQEVRFYAARAGVPVDVAMRFRFDYKSKPVRPLAGSVHDLARGPWYYKTATGNGALHPRQMRDQAAEYCVANAKAMGVATVILTSKDDWLDPGKGDRRLLVTDEWTADEYYAAYKGFCQIVSSAGLVVRATAGLSDRISDVRWLDDPRRWGYEWKLATWRT